MLSSPAPKKIKIKNMGGRPGGGVTFVGEIYGAIGGRSMFHSMVFVSLEVCCNEHLGEQSWLRVCSR